MMTFLALWFWNRSNEARRAADRDADASEGAPAQTHGGLVYLHGAAVAGLPTPAQWRRSQESIGRLSAEVRTLEVLVERLIRQADPLWLLLLGWIAVLFGGDYAAVRDIMEAITREPIALTVVPAILVVTLVFGFGWFRRAARAFSGGQHRWGDRLSLAGAATFLLALVGAFGWLRFRDWSEVAETGATGVTIALLTLVSAVAPGWLIERSVEPLVTSAKKTWRAVGAMTQLAVIRRSLRSHEEREAGTIRKARAFAASVWRDFHAYNEVFLSRARDKADAQRQIQASHPRVDAFLHNAVGHLLTPADRDTGKESEGSDPHGGGGNDDITSGPRTSADREEEPDDDDRGTSSVAA